MKPEIILIGAGGHCRSCIDVIEEEGTFKIAGIVDINPSQGNVLGYPIVGIDKDLEGLRSLYRYALVVIGQVRSPNARIQVFHHLKSLEFILPTITSPRSYVSKYAKLGEGTIIMHDVVVNPNAVIGNNCIINTKALIEHDAVIEDNCHISTGAIINGGATVGHGTFFGSNAISKEGVRTKDNEFIKASTIFKGY